jgi:hypothetical protein
VKEKDLDADGIVSRVKAIVGRCYCSRQGGRVAGKWIAVCFSAESAEEEDTKEGSLKKGKKDDGVKRGKDPGTE